MRAHRIAVVLFVLAGCAGPEASDAALCADYIHRICHEPLCPTVEARFEFLTTCEQRLLTNTGCTDESFAFTSPSRDRLLSCRVPLLRQGDAVSQAPACEDVEESLDGCPDVVDFLNGGTP